MKKTIMYFIVCFLYFFVVCWGGNGWCSENYDGYRHQKRQNKQKELKYNPYVDQWSYEKPDSTLKYNPYEDEWQYKENNENFQYNPYEDKWE